MSSFDSSWGKFDGHGERGIGLLRPGRPTQVAARPDRGAATGRSPRPGHGVPLRAVQLEGDRHALRRRGRRHLADPDRDGRDESQHAPSDRDGGLCAHDARPDRRAFRPRRRSRHRRHATRLRDPADHDRPARGLRPAHAAAAAGRGRDRTRRPGRKIPLPAARAQRRRRGPAPALCLRPEIPRARRPLLRRNRAPHLLHRRDDGARRPDREGRSREGRP